MQTRPRGFLRILAESLIEDARQIHGFYQETEELREQVSDAKVAYGKWSKRCELVKKLIEPTTRTVTIFDEGMSWCLSGLSKILERDIEMTPYWQIIKHNFDVLKLLIEAEASLDDAKSHLQDADKIANKIVDETARFLDDFDLVAGSEWLAYQQKTDEMTLLVNEWVNLQNRQAEMAKSRRFRMLLLMHGRRETLDSLLERFAQIGADRTQLQLAMAKYRSKIKQLQEAGGFKTVLGGVANQADILKQLSDQNAQTAAVKLSPEQRAKDAYDAVFGLTQQCLTASRQADDLIWQM